MGNNSEAEVRRQRIFGIWSIILAGMQTLFFILTVSLPEDASWAFYLMLALGVLFIGILGIVLGILGLSQTTQEYRVMCMSSAIANTAILGIAMFTVAMLGFVD